MTWRLLVLLCCALACSAQSIQRAEALWKAHDYKGAGHEFEALLKANPQNASYRVRYAELLFERFNTADAQSLFAEALKLDPKNSAALLGMARMAADEFDPKANEFAKQALEELTPKLLSGARTDGADGARRRRSEESAGGSRCRAGYSTGCGGSDSRVKASDRSAGR